MSNIEHGMLGMSTGTTGIKLALRAFRSDQMSCVWCSQWANYDDTRNMLVTVFQCCLDKTCCHSVDFDDSVFVLFFRHRTQPLAAKGYLCHLMSQCGDLWPETSPHPWTGWQFWGVTCTTSHPTSLKVCGENGTLAIHSHKIQNIFKHLMKNCTWKRK